MNLQLFSVAKGTPVRVRQGIGLVVSAGTSTKVVSTQGGVLETIVLNAALAGTLTITGFNNELGGALNFVLPIGMPAGSYDIGAEFSGTLQVTKSSASDDGKIMLVWR